MIYRVHHDKKGLLRSLSSLSSIQTKLGDYENAKISALEALTLAEEYHETKYVIEVECRSAELDMASGDYELSEHRLNHALSLYGQEAKQDATLSWLYKLLGQVSLLKRNYSLADQYLKQSLTIGQKLNSQLHIAQAMGYLAQVEFALGNLPRAHQIAQEAINLFFKLRLKRELNETQGLLQQVIKVQEQVN